MSENRNLMPTRKWVKDEEVTSCYTCKSMFGWFLRKHHCRFCGNIFCHSCSAQNALIPEELLSTDSKIGTVNEFISKKWTKSQEYRVCNECKNLIEFTHVVKNNIQQFYDSNMTIEELRTNAKSSIEWDNVLRYIMSIVGDLQTKLEDFNNRDRLILFRNIHMFAGHNRFLMQIIRLSCSDDQYAQAIDLLNKPKVAQCCDLNCGPHCYDKLTNFDAFNLFVHAMKNTKGDIQNKLKKVAFDYLRPVKIGSQAKYDEIDPKIFMLLVPIFVYYIQHDNGSIIEYLYNLCEINPAYCRPIWWEVQLYIEDKTKHYYSTYLTFSDKLKESWYSSSNSAQSDEMLKVMSGVNFVNIIETISKEVHEENKYYIQSETEQHFENNIFCPVIEDKFIKTLLKNSIKKMDSSIKPLIISMIDSENNIVKILHKRENVRRDQFIQYMIRLIDSRLKTEDQLDLNLITYNVLPIKSNVGLIECVSNSETLYEITNNLRQSIINYVMNNNMNSVIGDIRKNIVNSIAFYCVLTYVFGVGDRHDNNIMLTKGGKLFHIDYGYILGNDPKIMTPGIKLTPGMIDAMGGLSSKTYQEFIDLCGKIYNCFRRNTELIINMMCVLPFVTDFNMSPDQIKEFLYKRLNPLEDSETAKIHLVEHLGDEGIISKVNEWFHYHKQEKTVSSTVNRLHQALSQLKIVDTVTESFRKLYGDKPKN